MRKGVGRTVFRESFWDDKARKLGKNRKYIWTCGRPRAKGGSGGGESTGLGPLTIRDEGLRVGSLFANSSNTLTSYKLPVITKKFHTEKHLRTHWRRIVQTA